MKMGMSGSKAEVLGSESEGLKMELPSSGTLETWKNDVWEFIEQSKDQDASGPYREFLLKFDKVGDVSLAASNAMNALFTGNGRALCALRRGKQIVGIASLTIDTGKKTIEPELYLHIDERKHRGGLNTVRDWMRRRQEELGYRLVSTRALARKRSTS